MGCISEAKPLTLPALYFEMHLPDVSAMMAAIIARLLLALRFGAAEKTRA